MLRHATCKTMGFAASCKPAASTQEQSMTARHSVAATAVFILVLAGCASVDVRTVTNPDANLAALKTFDVMPHPTPPSATTQAGSDPMLVNSVSSQALRSDVFKGLENRGYAVSKTPDFVVAYYASTKEKLDVTNWDYGYPFQPYGWWGPPEQTVTQYTQGTVIIDVLDPASKTLLWRGQGVAPVSDDQGKYEQDLWKTVTAILEKFPRAPQGA
jgi:hypothetical protein